MDGRHPNARVQPRGPSPARQRGQQRSDRVRNTRARWSAVVDVLVRLGKADELFGDGVAETELSRIIGDLVGSIAQGDVFTKPDATTEAIAHAFDHMEGFIAYLRRDRIRLAAMIAAARNAPPGNGKAGC